MKYLLIAAVFLSCEPTNEQKVLNWIDEAHKPIHVTRTTWSSNNRAIYTLVDCDSCMLTTPPVSLTLPDTIR